MPQAPQICTTIPSLPPRCMAGGWRRHTAAHRRRSGHSVRDTLMLTARWQGKGCPLPRPFPFLFIIRARGERLGKRLSWSDTTLITDGVSVGYSISIKVLAYLHVFMCLSCIEGGCMHQHNSLVTAYINYAYTVKLMNEVIIQTVILHTQSMILWF